MDRQVNVRKLRERYRDTSNPNCWITTFVFFPEDLLEAGVNGARSVTGRQKRNRSSFRSTTVNSPVIPQQRAPVRQESVTMMMQMLIPRTVSGFVSTLFSLLSLTLLVLLCVIRKKRRMEGTYRPSAEERKQTGAAGSEKPGLPLPIPKEERLI
ncbi:hypothetical protein Q8A73_003613 [Channa argus]|nr:hypothetical protein Q8A73_003613 [Channa argus]